MYAVESVSRMLPPSEKGLRDRASPEVYASMLEMFLHPRNVKQIATDILHRLQTAAIPADLKELEMSVKQRIFIWAGKKRVDGARSAVTWDRLETIEFLNDLFAADFVTLEMYAHRRPDRVAAHEYGVGDAIVDSNEFRVTREFATVDGIESKLGREMSADDYKNLSVWQPYKIYASSGKFRYGNIIPVWQQAGRNRVLQLDKYGEGLHAEWRRSSLQAPSRGYDMSTIRSETGRRGDPYAIHMM